MIYTCFTHITFSLPMFNSWCHTLRSTHNIHYQNW